MRDPFNLRPAHPKHHSASGGTVAERLAQAGAIPTIEQFAAEIVAAARTPHPSGHTIYVGGADYVSFDPTID